MTKYQRNLLQLLAIAVVVGSALSLVSQLLAIEVFQGSYRKFFLGMPLLFLIHQCDDYQYENHCNHFCSS